MALYHKVKRELIADIQSGKFLLDKPLPNESDLAARFGISIGTLRRAVDELVSEHVLLRQQGRGTFVGQLDQERFMYQFFKIESEDGIREFPHSELIDFDTARSNSEESASLGLRGNPKVFRIKNLLLLQGKPVVFDRITLSCALFPSLNQEQFVQRSGTIYDLFQREFGVTVVGADERTRAILADEEAASVLQIPIGSPVLRVTRIARTFNQQPAELRISIINSQAHELVSNTNPKS
ncbi:MAG: GntR family transcriptional regulator [Polaromonas sp.]|jgi:GntR family transcriptional regulator|nr:GntR family transcriptional regulator [Polaromonas sp.]MBK9339390.1 GntR family transcriptional regulator [Rhodoferax sp.]